MSTTWENCLLVSDHVASLWTWLVTASAEVTDALQVGLEEG